MNEEVSWSGSRPEFSEAGDDLVKAAAGLTTTERQKDESQDDRCNNGFMKRISRITRFKLYYAQPLNTNLLCDGVKLLSTVLTIPIYSHSTIGRKAAALARPGSCVKAFSVRRRRRLKATPRAASPVAGPKRIASRKGPKRQRESEMPRE
jgi:hypothetical protein